MKAEKSEVIRVPTESGIIRVKVTAEQANYWKILEKLGNSIEQFRDIRSLVNTLTGGNPKTPTSKVYIFLRGLKKMGYEPVADWQGWKYVSPGKDVSLRYGRRKETLAILANRIVLIPEWWKKSEPQIAEILQQKGAIHAALVFIGKTMPEHRREYELWKKGAKERTGRKGKHLATVQEIANKILLIPEWWGKSENETIKILREENRATYVHEAFYYIGTLPEQQENFRKWEQGIYKRRRGRLGRREANVIRIAGRLPMVPNWENISNKKLGDMLKENENYVNSAKKLLQEKKKESREFSERWNLRDKLSYQLHGAVQGPEAAYVLLRRRIKRDECIKTILAMPDWETKTMEELVDKTGVSRTLVGMAAREIVERDPEQLPRYKKWKERGRKRKYWGPTALTSKNYRSKILLHLYSFQAKGDKYTKPFELTEDGIRIAIGMGSAVHVVPFLQELTKEGLIFWERAHVREAPRKRMCFFLTPSGVQMAKELLEKQQTKKHEEEVVRKQDTPIKKELPTDRLYPDDRKILGFLHGITEGKTFGEFYPYELTGEGIVEKIGIDRDTVKRSLGDLERKGLITREKKNVRGTFFKRDVYLLTEKGMEVLRRYT